MCAISTDCRALPCYEAASYQLHAHLDYLSIKLHDDDAQALSTQEHEQLLRGIETKIAESVFQVGR